ncbi:Uncharacterised protein [Citrobacter freundii]|nr:Uncharacterised protein [Citrobacter freundii]
MRGLSTLRLVFNVYFDVRVGQYTFTLLRPFHQADGVIGQNNRGSP